MKLLEESFERLKYLRRVRSLVVMAVSCCVCINGFGQLIYLTDSRSVSGSASLTYGSQYPTYSPFSSSATPSAPFADFQGNASGTAGYVDTNGTIPYITATVQADQNSFLHSQELYYRSDEYGSSPTGQGEFDTQGNSSLQVTFQVASPVAYNLNIEPTGDPIASGDVISLSSSSQGVLISENTSIGVPGEFLQWDYPNKFSGTFTPGNTYTLSLESGGGNNAIQYFTDGGGLLVDLTVPEPSMTALTGLAFLIFLLRANRCGTPHGNKATR